MEQSLPTKALTPGRNLGIRYNDDFQEKRMTLSTGVFWETGSFSKVGEAQDRLSKSTGFNLTGRVTGLPWYEDKGARFMHLGLSYSHKFRNNDIDSPVILWSRPESRITDQRLVDTGSCCLTKGTGSVLNLLRFWVPSLFKENTYLVLRMEWVIYISGDTISMAVTLLPERFVNTT